MELTSITKHTAALQKSLDDPVRGCCVCYKEGCGPTTSASVYVSQTVCLLAALSRPKIWVAESAADGAVRSRSVYMYCFLYWAGLGWAVAYSFRCSDNKHKSVEISGNRYHHKYNECACILLSSSPPSKLLPTSTSPVELDSERPLSLEHKHSTFQVGGSFLDVDILACFALSEVTSPVESADDYFTLAIDD